MLADRLVEMGMLNPWQAKQLLDGRTKFTLGPYRVVDSLGSGGMGQVFKAEHGILGAGRGHQGPPPLSKATPESRANFTREIRAQARLDHVNLVRALDADEDNNVYYLVTEYVPGCDLRKLVRRNGPLSMEDAASIISQVAAGLQHAHQQGLIHRDVKPANVLVTPEGHAKLSGPRLGRSLGRQRSKRPTARQDRGNGRLSLAGPHQGSLGANARLGHLFAGLHALLCGDRQGALPPRHHRRQGPGALRVAAPGPPPVEPHARAPFVETLAEMMAKDPADRIPSAAEVIERLTPWTGNPRPVSPADNSGRRRKGVTWSFTSPPVGPSDSTDPDETQLKDTTPNFPEFSPSDPRGQANRWAGPARAVRCPESPSVVVDLQTSPLSPADCLRPLLVLVGIPLVLLGLLSLFWWLLAR